MGEELDDLSDAPHHSHIKALRALGLHRPASRRGPSVDHGGLGQPRRVRGHVHPRRHGQPAQARPPRLSPNRAAGRKRAISCTSGSDAFCFHFVEFCSRLSFEKHSTHNNSQKQRTNWPPIVPEVPVSTAAGGPPAAQMTAGNGGMGGRTGLAALTALAQRFGLALLPADYNRIAVYAGGLPLPPLLLWYPPLQHPPCATPHPSRGGWFRFSLVPARPPQ